MSFEYSYPRNDLGNGMYDIDNPNRIIDESGITLPEDPTPEEYSAYIHRPVHQINLCDEAKAALPGKKFRLICNATTATFIFEDELTITEKDDILDVVVDNHRNNV